MQLMENTSKGQTLHNHTFCMQIFKNILEVLTVVEIQVDFISIGIFFKLPMEKDSNLKKKKSKTPEIHLNVRYRQNQLIDALCVLRKTSALFRKF